MLTDRNPSVVQALHRAMLRRLVFALAVSLAAGWLLAGCGGGDDDEAELQRRNPTVDCKAKPELCF